MKQSVKGPLQGTSHSLPFLLSTNILMNQMRNPRLKDREYLPSITRLADSKMGIGNQVLRFLTNCSF